jgi:transposase
MIPRGLRVLLCAHPVDMRRSFDGLATLVIEKMNEDPTAHGALFVFVSTDRTRAKLLWRDATGFCILYKRLDSLVFALPDIPRGAARIVLDTRTLSTLLDGVAESAPPPTTVKGVARAAKALARERLRKNSPQLSL